MYVYVYIRVSICICIHIHIFNLSYLLSAGEIDAPLADLGRVTRGKLLEVCRQCAAGEHLEKVGLGVNAILFIHTYIYIYIYI